MKKVIIIGAGISGLTAGIYALKSGYDVEIYEMHNIAGGECTGWNRGKYHFDGCIHWLMGSKKGSTLNDVWREVGALDDTINIINTEYFGQFKLGDRTLTCYRDVDKLENHLLELSPVDDKEIKKMCKAIRVLRNMEIPSDKPFDLMTMSDGIKMGMKMMPYIPYMKYNNIDITELVNKFKDPLIRTALTELLPPYYSALALLSTLGSMANRDSGWPVGGSLKFAQRMENKFKELGGKIFFNARTERIIVKEGIAKGIMLSDGCEVFGDFIVSATDGYETLYKLLDGDFLSNIHKEMFTAQDNDHVRSSFQAWAGIAADLSNEPDSLSIELQKPVQLGGNTYNRIWLKSYCFDKTMAPLGCSVVTAHFPVENFDWWNSLYADKESYKREKEHIANVVKEVIEKQFPVTLGKVELMNVATPMTYVRYCNAWRGAWMTWPTTPKIKVRSLPMKLEGLSNFVMAGQWTMPPGGLPTAVLTGKWAIQHICAQDK